MRIFLGMCVVAVAVGVAARGNAAIAITSCGETVPAGDKGVLQNQLDCQYSCTGDRSIVCGFEGDKFCVGNGSCDAEYLTLERGAVLDLNGHDVVAAFHSVPVYCGSDDGAGRCVVKGPGHIWGGTRGIISSNMDIVVKNVTITADYDAVRTDGRVTMADLDLGAGFLYGIRGGRGLTLKNVRSGVEEISSDGDIELHNVELGPSSGTFVSAGTIRGRDVVLKGYAMIDGRDVTLRRAISSAHPNGETDTLVRGRRRLRLVDSNVVRIVSGKTPRLVRSTCQQSLVEGTSDSWSLCSGD